MRYFPVFIDLDRQPVLVVGGGEEAAQKVRLLRKSPATIEVIADQLCNELRSLADRGAVIWRNTAFDSSMLDGKRLVYAASDDPVLNARVSFSARARSIPVNVVDQPQFCSFITPSIVDRDPVTVAISTEGTAPVLGRSIKSKIETMLPSNLGALAAWAGGLRRRVAEKLSNGRDRRRFWDGFFHGPVASSFIQGKLDQASQEAERLLDAGLHGRVGKVSLVGAGPGDPDLMTLKAMRALQEADVIVADRLGASHVLELARRDAKRIMVGKSPGKPSPRQDEINQIMLEEVAKGQHVVRLKGGDPFIFGRGGEELDFLERHGIEVDIVPGISAAMACAASVRLPITTRNERRSLTLLTGHASDGPAEHDWKSLVASDRMLAIYMGVGSASHIQARLREHGMEDDRPVTVVENGTLANERVVLASIGNLTEAIIDAAVKGPAILFIGAHPRKHHVQFENGRSRIDATSLSQGRQDVPIPAHFSTANQVISRSVVQ